MDTVGFYHPDDVTPMSGDDRTVSGQKWPTPWHDFINDNGILAESGRIRVVLRDDQFMIQRFNATCAHSDTSDQVFRRHMISHSGVSDHPEMTPSGAVW